MKLSNEMKIGILVAGVAILLIGLTLRVGKFSFTKKGYTIKVHFYRIEGLERNAPVRLNGLEIGSLKAIRILYNEETTMELTLWLDEKAKLREGAKAYVKNMGLLGEKYIELTGGNKAGAFLPADTLIIGEEPLDFEKLVAKGDVIADNLKVISENLSERLRINSQAIDNILKDLASITHNVNERLAVNHQAIDEIIANLHTTTGNLEELSDDLKMNPWKLMYKGKERTRQK